MRELLITALGPALVLFISELFRYIHAKNERKERFFYELYPKRLKIYEKIIREIYPIGAFEKTLMKNYRDNNTEATTSVAKEKAERLNRLAHRNVLFGHSDITLALCDFAELCEAVAALPPMDDTFPLLAPGFTLLGERIMKFIREESGKYIVNKKLFEEFKKFEAALRKEERNYKHQPGPERHPYERDSY
jgi:hypothetical protein